MSVISVNTYSSIIENFTDSVYNVLKNGSVSEGNIYNYFSGKVQPSNQATVTVREDTSGYTAPSRATILADVKSFIANKVGVDISKKPTTEGLISILFALNFFASKVILKQRSGTDKTYHFYYTPNNLGSYTAITPTADYYSLISKILLTDFQSQLSSFNSVSKNAEKISTKMSSSTSTCSCSSSSCSSSSCTSCSCNFIVYFIS